MRKKYIVPLIAVEHYELTQSIAACTVKINATSNSCVLQDVDSTSDMRNLAKFGTFLKGADGCDYYPEGTDKGDGICYHTSTTTAFTS